MTKSKGGTDILPVHLHSEYSALDGFSHPKEIANRLVELDLPGAFLTDHGTVAGLAPFAKALQEQDLWVGYGMEAYQAAGSRADKADADGKAFKKGQDSFHLILLAKSLEGYHNLLRISDAAHRTGFYYDPRVDMELLKKYREGLVCTSACMGSLANQRLKVGDTQPLYDLARLFGDDFYVEIHTYEHEEQIEQNLKLVQWAKEHGFPLLVATDAHYTRPEEYDIHEALLCAQYNERIDGPKRTGNYVDADGIQRHHPGCLYIMNEAEVRERLSYLPDWAVDDAVANTDLLMQRCDVTPPKPGLYLPKWKEAEDYSSEDKLFDLVQEGLYVRYADEETLMVPEHVIERAEAEFEAIVDAGLQDYFLIVWDYINYAMRHGVMVGPGRGSVGGSILAYALGITAIDPLKHELQFERFWNPGRADGLPDIDVDFEQSARQFMIEYVKTKYGKDNVLPIGNHIFMRPKSAIDKAGMVLYDDPPYSKMAAIKAIIETTTDAGLQKTWDDMWEMLGELAAKEGKPHPLDEYRDQYPDLFDLAQALSGRLQTYGVHASAVVISEVELNDHLPARMASDDAKRKVLVTQAEMKGVEKAGFPKFDFLGLRNLDTIMMTAILSGDFGDPDVLGPRLFDLIEERQKGELERADPELREALVKVVKLFREETDYDSLPESYWEQVDKGHTLGFFQVEMGGAARRIAKNLKPRSIEDLGAIVALNRPGPLRDLDEDGRNTVDRFLARRNGEEETVFPHSFLEDLLAPSYGDFLYQEQVIAYFRKIGYSLSDADHIRKILGKKLVAEMDKEFPTYMSFAENVMEKQSAEAIWNKIQEFSKYSFNKAHGVGYGTILAWTMYAKWRWPVEFVMASIATNPKKVAAYIGEGRRMDITFRLPSINHSKETISKLDDSIIYGLRDIKGIGEDAAEWIVTHQPYDSPEDFYTKAAAEKPVVVKANHRQALMDAGCFDEFGYRLAKCERCAGKGRVRIDPKKRILDDCPECNKVGYAKVELPDEKTRVAQEEELLGIPITDLNKEIIERNQEKIDALDDLGDADQDSETEVTVPGVVKEVEERKASWYIEPGKPTKWARVTIEWHGEEVTFAAFPDKYKEKKDRLRKGIVGGFTLKTSKKGPQLIDVERYV